MFRKHNPKFKIDENISQCGLPNYREGKILGGGGTKILHQDASATLQQYHLKDLGVQQSQQSMLYQTL